MRRNWKLSKFTGFCKIGDVTIRYNDALCVPMGICQIKVYDRATYAKMLKALRDVKKFATRHQVQLPLLLNDMALVVAPKSTLKGLEREVRQLTAIKPKSLGSDINKIRAAQHGFLALDQHNVFGLNTCEGEGNTLDRLARISGNLGSLGVYVPLFIKLLNATDKLADTILAVNPWESADRLIKKYEIHRGTAEALPKFDSTPYI